MARSLHHEVLLQGVIRHVLIRQNIQHLSNLLLQFYTGQISNKPPRRDDQIQYYLISKIPYYFHAILQQGHLRLATKLNAQQNHAIYLFLSH